MSQPIFEFVGEGDSELISLGPWKVVESQTDAISFDVGAPPADEQPTWRINLPADASDAEQSLADAEVQLRAMQAALDAIPGKLDTVVAKSQTTESVSFAAGEASPAFEAGSPEAELFDLLAEAERAESAGPEVSFGIAESASEAWKQAKVQFAALLDQVDREFLHMTVETNREGSLLARSMVGWGGDAATVWSQSVSSEEMSLHSRSLDLALTSRQVRLRMFTTITTGAAKLAIMLGSNPIGPIAALPVAWKYVQDVLAQVREYRELT